MKPTTLSKVTFSIAAFPRSPRPGDYAGETLRGQSAACHADFFPGLVYGAALFRNRPRRPAIMAFDDLEAELALLINQMDTPPGNAHDLYLRIMELLNEYKGLGLPLPDDLVRVEKELEAFFKAEAAPAKKR